ncbi:MAG TPA: alpha/beta hydrolase domain-containing protein [Myxococcota bacterium]|nr:alpha/beta hydrolase domain-containing protein [Myxococcota bacterium]
MTRVADLVLTLICVAASPLAAAASSPTLTENPAGIGLHGHPYDAVPTVAVIPQAPALDLAALGYVEREFQMSGGATVYQQRGLWSSNGAWSVSVAQTNVPYTTRILVRYPTDPAQFNGTVVFEWLNDTTGGDQDPLWSQIYQQALRDGYAYVGVTAQAAGMKDLAVWDPVRYGSLGASNDGQSYDIFSQAAQAVRANAATLLGGLVPRRLIGGGDSQSAFRIVTYVNAIQPVSHAFDGFLAVGRAAVGAPLGNGLIATSPIPALIRSDNRAPFIQLNTEGDIVELGAGLSRQADNSYLRTWELPGAAHIDAHEATYELATLARDQPNVPIPMCQFGTPITGTGTPLDGINQVNNMPLFEVEDAALVALHNWLSLGVPPPHSPRISTTTFFFVFDVVQRDQLGNALGGIRLPDIQAPSEFYSPINFSIQNPNSLSIDPMSLISLVQSTLNTLFVTGSIDDDTLRSSGLCLLSGFFTPLPSATLSRLYATHASYVAKFTAAANAAMSAGFLTPADRDAAVAAAQAAPIP